MIKQIKTTEEWECLFVYLYDMYVWSLPVYPSSLTTHISWAVTRIRTETQMCEHRETHKLCVQKTAGPSARDGWPVLWQMCCCTSWESISRSSEWCVHTLQHTSLWVMYVVYIDHFYWHTDHTEDVWEGFQKRLCTHTRQSASNILASIGSAKPVSK